MSSPYRENLRPYSSVPRAAACGGPLMEGSPSSQSSTNTPSPSAPSRSIPETRSASGWALASRGCATVSRWVTASSAPSTAAPPGDPSVWRTRSASLASWSTPRRVRPHSSVRQAISGTATRGEVCSRPPTGVGAGGGCCSWTMTPAAATSPWWRRSPTFSTRGCGSSAARRGRSLPEERGVVCTAAPTVARHGCESRPVCRTVSWGASRWLWRQGARARCMPWWRPTAAEGCIDRTIGAGPGATSPAASQ